MASNTQSLLLPIEGEFPVDPEIRVQPTVQRTSPVANVGWKWRRRYTIINNADEPLANFPHAIDLGRTDGLVTYGFALSSGNDLRVWHEGLEIARNLVDWNSASVATLCWIVIPYLGVGETMTVDVVFGNSAAGSPPTLTAGVDLPAFDITVAGANRSTNAKWVYLVERIAANAGKGGAYVSSGTAQPEVRFGVPGAWQPANTLQSDDDRRQETYSTYTDSGTKYQNRFEARRAAPGALLVGQDNGLDGRSIRLPIGITAVRSDIRWINMAIGDTDVTPIGQVVIVTRNQPNETWKTLYSNTALQATEATIATATHTPASPVKEVAYAVWPQDGNNIDLAALPDRYINAGWYTTLEVHPTSSNVVTTLVSETTWTPSSAAVTPNFWHKADDPVMVAGHVDGQTVATWVDFSGNGRTAAQSTSGKRPTYQTNELNSLPAVRFDGTDDDLTITGHGLTKPCTIFAVARLVSASVGAGDRIIHSSNMLMMVSGTGANDYVMNGGSDFQYSTDTLDSNAHVHMGLFAGTGNSTGSLDGTEATGSAGTTAPSANMVYGATGVASWMPMDLFEVIDVSGALSAADRARYVGYLAWKYGLQGNLPAAHPFKSAAPVVDEIYELATELRSGGGGDAVGIPPYKSIFLGNAKLAFGVGTPRLACKLAEQVVVKTAERRVEIWNSGLTAKVEDAPIPVVSAIEGALDETGTATERPSAEWLPMMPVVDPLTNSSFDTGVSDWTRGTVTAGVTASALARVTATFDSTPASGLIDITANSAGAGAVVEEIASDFLPIGNRQSVQLGIAVRTQDVDIQPTPTIWFYNAAQALIGASRRQADWAILASNTWYRRLFAAAVLTSAVYYRVGVTVKDKVGAQTGDVWIDTLAVNDTEIAILDVATGTLVLSASWTNRYAYA